MLLVWLTGVRPGSFVVGPGYAKGESLGLPGRVRETSDTLRWSDVQFFNTKDGIAVRITFRFHKGYRNPHKDNAHANDAVRTFVFLPSKGERLGFDLALILLGIACNRGLFVQTLEEILAQTSSDVFLAKHNNIDQQAVFVQADQSGRLQPEKPMLSSALNPKLQQICVGIGLLERNTYYSLRRTAIIETIRSHGTEQAKNLAYHVASANSLFFYDNVGFGDLDIQQFREGGEESMSREDLRKYFSQANLARYRPSDEHEDASFKDVLTQQVRERLLCHEDYISKEKELKDVYSEVGNKLEEMQTNGQIPDTERIPLGFSGNAGALYKALATTYHLTELTQKIDDQLKERKALYRALRLKLRKDIQQEIRAKHTAALSDSHKQSGKVILGSHGGFQPHDAHGLAIPDLDSSAGSVLTMERDIDAVPDEEETEEIDEEFLEQQNMHSREEPECWNQLKDVVEIQLGSGEPSADATKVRQKFLVWWHNLCDSPVAQSNLNCPRCQIDPTVEQAAKDRKFNLYRLKTHMRGGFHTREKQIRRALEMDGMDHTSQIPCPVCQILVKSVKLFVKHLKNVHPEQLWEEFDDESGDENYQSEVTDFEGFSDHAGEGAVGGDPDGDEEEEVSDFQGFSSPPPTYEGKGKGRA